MKKGLIISAFVVLGLTACHKQESKSEVALADKSVEVGIVEHLGDTLPLDLTFKNELDSTVTLRQLVNKPTIFSFVYFDCPGLCSPLLDGVSELVEQSDMELGKDYQIITVSFNTTDTPEKARAKKKTFLHKQGKFHAQDWIYLTGDSASISKLIYSVGFKVKKQGVDFAHASAIIMVSPIGKITRYLYGLTFLPFDVKMAIIESSKEEIRPSISKVLQLCFSYDPAGHRYILDTTRIIGSFMIVLVVTLFLILVIKNRKKKKTS